MTSVELHIITNCVKSTPSTVFIDATYASFCDTFGAMPAVVWCDDHPKCDAFDPYCRNMRQSGFKTINKTSGLVDAYKKIINTSSADYLFVLEHDWLFNKTNIHHSLDDILKVMCAEELCYLRFNKICTRVKGWDKQLTQRDRDGFFYCVSNCWSGNPHLLDRRLCLQRGIIDKIDDRGELTMERRLTNDSALPGAIYGPLNHPATTIHLDGREDEPKPFWDQDRIRKHYEMLGNLAVIKARSAIRGKTFEVDLGIVVPAYKLPEQPALKRRFLGSLKKDCRPRASVEILFVQPDRFDIVSMLDGREVFNLSKAYNAGLHYFKDRAALIACADIDLLFPKGFIDHTIEKALQKPFCARVRLVDPAEIVPRNWAHWALLKPRPGTGAWNCMKYDDYARIGGFNEEMCGWGGIDTDFSQRRNAIFGGDGSWYDASLPLMHVNHPPHVATAPRRPSENIVIANAYRKKPTNWLARYESVSHPKQLGIRL